MYNIFPIDQSILSQAQAHLDMLAKPPGSLGQLELIASQVAAIQCSLSPSIAKRCVIVLASDNGVFEEGVASAPQSVTAIQTVNIARGLTGVGVLARQFSTDIIVADLGVNADLPKLPNLLHRKIRKSTSNIAKMPAMSRDEAMLAIKIGARLADDAKQGGYMAVGVGEMGIGNTTTSSAVLSALLKLSEGDVDQTVGRGAGLDDAAYQKKVDTIKTALLLNAPNGADPVDILAKVGGFDLCAMVGVYLGCAQNRVPVVIDGFISIVAALCAVRLNPIAKQYMIASHHSFERGYALALAELDLPSYLRLDMRLGEGSGCPLMFAVIDGALAVFNNMATFSQAKIDDEYLDSINNITF